jgi:phospholipase C
MPTLRRTALALALAAAPLLARPAPKPSAPSAADLKRIEHVIVIYQENWSFDGLYGQFPGADGVRFGTPVKQLEKDGVTPLSALPRPMLAPGKPDPRFPEQLPVETYDLARTVGPEVRTGDLVHRFYTHQQQIAGGANTGFAAWSDNPGLVLSGYDATTLPVGKLAREFTLCDRAFQSAFGGSFLNHQWLVAARTPRWEGEAPPADKLVSALDAQGRAATIGDDRQLTPRQGDQGWFAVNTIQPMAPPFDPRAQDPGERLPPLTNPHIGDRLDAAGVTWAYYAGGWDAAERGRADPDFQYHHQPLAYFKDCAPGTPCRRHLQDASRFLDAVKAGRLPAVSFVKPLGPLNEHPGYADVATGEREVERLVTAVRQSRAWASSLIVITYDEFGGRWDHVPPPRIDAWGPGTRIPMIVVSPFARRHTVDHTPYETVSILAFIERRFGLPPLSDRDGRADPLSGALDPALLRRR